MASLFLMAKLKIKKMKKKWFLRVFSTRTETPKKKKKVKIVKFIYLVFQLCSQKYKDVYFISGVYSHILYPPYFVDFAHMWTNPSLMDENFGTWRAMMPAVSWVMGCADFGNWFNTSNTNPATKKHILNPLCSANEEISHTFAWQISGMKSTFSQSSSSQNSPSIAQFYIFILEGFLRVLKLVLKNTIICGFIQQHYGRK
jgi:hypothetical protein